MYSLLQNYGRAEFQMKGAQVSTRVANVHSIGTMYFAGRVDKCGASAEILLVKVLQVAIYTAHHQVFD
jgi:hypothetical protein